MASMETVASRDGTPIAYERGGEGPPLVLVHCTTSDHLTWELVLPELQKHFTVYGMDRRGRGESGGGNTYDIEREYEDVVEVIYSIDVPADLFGHSYGAICALEAALRSSRVRRLILYEGTFPVPKGAELYPPEALDRIRSHLEADDQEGALTTFYRDIVLMSPEEIEIMRSLPVWPSRVALAPTIPHEMRALESYISNGRGAARQPDRRDAPSDAYRPQNGAGPVRARGRAVPDAGLAPECERSESGRCHRGRHVADRKSYR